MMTYRRIDNEDAVAHGWYVITIFLLIAAIIYGVMIMVVNNLIAGPEGDNAVGFNADVSSGKLSRQAVGAASFNVTMLTNAPLFAIIAALCYAAYRAIYYKQGA